MKSFHYKYNQLKCLKPDSGHHVLVCIIMEPFEHMKFYIFQCKKIWQKVDSWPLFIRTARMNVINSISKLVFHKYKKRVDKSWFSFLMFTLDDEKTLGVHILYKMCILYINSIKMWQILKHSTNSGIVRSVIQVRFQVL